MYNFPFKDYCPLKGQPVSRAATLKPVDTPAILTNLKIGKGKQKNYYLINGEFTQNY